ncbi:DoxX family protein [Cryptosporangium aurantiacum]|uniref:Putative oxidoreductase n=1 Tax=Cryptosporangium aurantiacum TaxID=134849 RepID=A0A1M7KQ72_9ACTN|nr:DoxX family protein [Cryptosporangium aurantiacum]SHM67649.1 putative oxidoreductase [Cryptosporangium aurantiacum]
MNWVDVGLLLIRLSLGATLLMHGWNHWLGGGKIAGTAGWFESLGLRPGVFQAWASVVTEIAAGLGLIVGLLTPLACAATIGVMAVAAIVAHRPNGFFVFRDGYEYVLLIAVVSAGLAAIGPGRISLDHALGVEITGLAGIAIAVLAGLGGTALLLATTWRPHKVPTNTP